jgi:hypothetical protein
MIWRSTIEAEVVLGAILALSRGGLNSNAVNIHGVGLVLAWGRLRLAGLGLELGALATVVSLKKLEVFLV